MSLKEDPKKVFGPTKEDIEYMEWLKKQPPPPIEKVRAQFRASNAFREKQQRTRNGQDGT